MSTKSSSAKVKERKRLKYKALCTSQAGKALNKSHNYIGTLSFHLLSISTVETGRVFGEAEVVATPADGTQQVTQFAEQYQL